MLALTTNQTTIAVVIFVGLYIAGRKKANQRKPSSVVLIGGSSGIGKEMALQLNCDKVIVGRRKAELDNVAGCCSGNTFVYPADITIIW
jgi:NADP-dependent 3-hydroxy acid dehydrogenase YdfG